MPQEIQDRIDELEQRVKILENTLNNVGAYVYIKDLQSRYVYANEKVVQLFGFPHSEIIGYGDCKFFSKDVCSELVANDKKVIASGVAIETEEVVVLANQKETLTYLAVKKPLFDDNGNIIGITGVSTNITNQKKLEKRLEYLSTTDQLTQIFNRLKIDEVFEYELNRMRRSESLFSIILLDIDNFKDINDTYGHQAGDEVLIKIAQILKEHTRSTDIVGRWGGEEFMIICAETDKKGVVELGNKLCGEINSFDFDNMGNVSGSFGITTYIADDDIDSMIRRADLALYRAKENGKNRVEAE